MPEDSQTTESRCDSSAAVPLDHATHADHPRTLKAILRRLGPAGPLAVIAATLPAIGGFLLLGTLTIVGPWLKSHGALGVVIYAVGFAVCAGLAILPTYAQSILGGWAFGFWPGYPAAAVGVVGGALLGYTIALRATGDRVVRLIAEQPKWQAVYQALLGSGFWKTLGIVTLVRLPPSSPFAMTNLVLAATRVRPLVYAIGTFIGLTPRTAAVVYFAAGFHQLTSETLTSNPYRTAMWIASAVLTLIVIAVIGYIANHALAKLTAGNASLPEAKR